MENNPDQVPANTENKRSQEQAAEKGSLPPGQSDNQKPGQSPPIAAPAKRAGPSARELYKIPTSPLKGKYEFLQVIGAGGAGVIYKAKQNPLGRIVAIKMVHSHIVSATSLMRFEKEAKTISTLSHPNIITIHDFGISEDEQPYMVMDYMEGVSLSDHIKEQGRLSIDETCDYAIQICDGLSHAHKKGILHRDLKPNNLMLVKLETGDYHVKILDFGLAKLLHGDEDEDQKDHLTKTGETVGTPAYMSPEQVMGKSLDQRTDIYSLGCVIYNCLTGSPPFLGETKMETMLMQLNNPPTPVNEKLDEDLLDPYFDRILLKLLAKSAQDRFADMQTVKENIIAARKGLFESDPGAQAPHLDNSQLKTVADMVDTRNESDRVQDKRESQAQFHAKTSTAFFNRHKTLTIAAAAVILLGLPMAFLINTLNRSVEEDARDKPELTEREKEMAYRKNATRLLHNGNFADSEFNTYIERNSDKTAIAVEGKNISDEALRHLSKVKILYTLDLTGAPITDEGLKILASYPGIRELNLTRTKISESGLKELLKLPALTILNLEKTAITDSAAPVLAQIKRLQSLDLRETAVTSKSLLEISRLKELRRLNLADTGVDDNNLETLSSPEQLTELDLSGCNISDAGLAKIARLKNLVRLNLSGTNVTDEGLVSLVSLENLGYLDLSKTKLTPGCIKNFCKIPWLTELNLGGCEISWADLVPYQRMNKNIRVLKEVE
ncbi:protein kinase [bacterium]|nr:protein kinase [bacterium]